jgi:hypothetical protein
MRSLGRRLMLCAGVAAVGALVAAGSASAKGLPVGSVSVSTAQPQAGQPVEVVVRFADGFDLGDEFGWASGEIAVFAVARTDSSGWPLDRNDPGLPVRLRRMSKGVYRGSFTVADPGEYVVVSRSAIVSHEDRLRGFVARPDFPVPLRVHVVSAATGKPSGSSGISMLTIEVSAAFVAVIIAGAGIWFGSGRRSQPAGRGHSSRGSPSPY